MTGGAVDYAATWGAFMRGPDREDVGLLAKATKLLDERDSTHRAAYGHLPGVVRECSLEHGTTALPGLLVSLRAGGASDGESLDGSSYELAAKLWQRAPMSPVAVVPVHPVDGVTLGSPKSRLGYGDRLG